MHRSKEKKEEKIEKRKTNRGNVYEMALLPIKCSSIVVLFFSFTTHQKYSNNEILVTVTVRKTIAAKSFTMLHKIRHSPLLTM